jgi:hypothetical protein
VKKRTVRVDPIIGIAVALVTVGLIVFAARVSNLSAARPVGTFLDVGGAPPETEPLLLTDDGGAIKWNRGYLFSASGGPTGPIVGGIQATGENKSDEFIGPLSGFIRSEITGQQFPILINDSAGKDVPLDGYGVPAGNQFRVFAPLRNGVVPLSAEEFMRDFSRFTFVFQYGNHTYTRRFTPEEVQKEMQRVGAFLTPKPNPNRVGARRMPSKDDARWQTLNQNALTASCTRWLPNPNLRESLQQTIEHQIRRLAQVMAILELAMQTQPFSLQMFSRVCTIGDLLDAALAAEPPKPTPTAPDRRRQFRVIEGGKS